MARNGSGTYSNPYPNFVSGTVISSAETDANNSDIATALTQSIAVDGQAVVTAHIPLATHKLTGVSAGSAATDSLNLGQAQAEAFVWCGTAGGSANAITLAPTPAITAYAAGQRFVWMASGSVNTGATTVAISGLGTIALQDNGAALVAGNHAANKMFMGILNTTSTVQIMQVQSSGTDPLIVSSLTVSGTSALTGVTTHGDDVVSDSDSTDDLGTTSVRWANLFVDAITTTDQITATGFTGTLDGILGSGTPAAATVTQLTSGGVIVSDTDSTDDLGTTGVRWANLFVDAITATDQVTATGFTGTLDGILGSGTPAAATVTTMDASGVATATTFEPDGDTSASDNAAIGYTSVEGLVLTGQGSSGDVTIKNDADGKVMEVLTGTTTAAFTGQVTGTGFTGTLDGILGGGTPAAATVTTIDASGVATATTFEPDGDTSAADNAAIGYTSAEGLVLTGQGSSTDIVLKNDADAAVISIPTGTTNVTIAGDLTISGDDLTMGTNTSGAALIADGTNFNPVVISGDISINTSGVAAIGSGVIVEADIADNAVTLAKMAGGTDGNIISFDASGNPVAVATGDDGQVLTSSGAGAVCAFEDAAGGATAATMQASTSGTAVDFTGIPSGTVAIDVIWSAYSCSTAAHSPAIQIGDSGGVETSGYLVMASNGASKAATTTFFETMFDPSGMNAGNTAHISGSLRLVDPATNTWIWMGMQNRNETDVGFGAGTKSLSATLDRVRFTTAGGDTLSAGKTRIIYW